MNAEPSSADATESAPSANLPSHGTGWVGQLLGFLLCVGLPGFVSLISPISRVTLERSDGRVSARAKVYIFFVIPIRSPALAEVTSVDYRINDGTPPAGRTEPRKSPPTPEGHLVFHGPNETSFGVPASPSSIESVTQQARAFLDDPQATQLKLFVVHNGALSIGVTGFLSLFTLLYFLNLAVNLIRAVQRRCGVDEKDLLLGQWPPPAEPTSVSGNARDSATNS